MYPHHHLPHEVWLHVAHYLPASSFEQLMSLNSTFFSLGMDCRYRQISFAFLNEQTMKRLVRLQDPYVAKFVRILHIYPGFLQEALDQEEAGVVDWLSNSRFRSLKEVVRHLRLGKRKKSDPSLATPATAATLTATGANTTTSIRKPYEEISKVLLDVLTHLPNLTDYYIMWCGLPSIRQSPVPYLIAALQPTLRKLSLEVSLENASSLLGPAFSIPNLEHLEITVRVDRGLSTTPVNHSEHVSFRHLGPPSSAHPLLHTLSIQSWEPLDIAPLFYAIRTIRSLRTLVVAIPTAAPHLGDPAALAHFLNRHAASLLDFSLRASHYGGGFGVTPNPFSMSQWVRQALADVRLDRLRKLDISSSLFPRDASLHCVNKFATTINALTLTGRYHSFDDVVSALGVLDGATTTATAIATEITTPAESATGGAAAPVADDIHHHHHLNSLRLGPVSLTPQLMDLLAQRLPSLQRLELLVKEILPEEGANQMDWQSTDCDYDKDDDDFSFCGRSYQSSVSSQDQLDDQIEAFCYAMEQRSYPQWAPKSISISIPSSYDKCDYEADVMACLWKACRIQPLPLPQQHQQYQQPQQLQQLQPQLQLQPQPQPQPELHQYQPQLHQPYQPHQHQPQVECDARGFPAKMITV